MTLDQVLKKVTEAKPVSQRQVYRYIVELGIKPIGARQRPQRYPADTAERILTHLGLAQPAEQPRSTRIVTMGQLRTERSKSNRRAK